jgi:hypothetical protein
MLTLSNLFETVLPVIVKQKIEPKDIWICPHCNKEIGEKEMFYNQDDDAWFHRSCKGQIELPKSKYKLNV